MRLQPLQNDEIIANASTDSNFLRLQTAIPVVKEDELPGPGLEDRRRRHDELASQAGFESDVDEHPRLQFVRRMCALDRNQRKSVPYRRALLGSCRSGKPARTPTRVTGPRRYRVW